MENKNFKICDVIKFTNIDLFEYDDDDAGVIELEKEYIIVDMFDGAIVISDGDVEFIFDEVSLQFAKRIRRMRFKIGDELKITNLKKLKFSNETFLKQNRHYKVMDVVIREGTPIIFDGQNEVALLPEELLFVEKIRATKSRVQKQKNKEYKYVPSSNEMRILQEDIRKFVLTSLIDKSLDERNFDMLKLIVESNCLSEDENNRGI